MKIFNWVRQNNKNKNLQIFKILLLAGFLFIEFFGFGNLANAQTGCNYQIQFNSDNYSVAYTATFNLTASVVGTGCSGSVGINLMLISPNSPSGRSISDKSSGLQNGAASATFPISAQNYKSDIDSSNNLTFQILIDGNPAKSLPLIVNVTGIPSATFPVLPVQVTFPSTGGTAVFNDGQQTDVSATLQTNGSTSAQLQSVTSIYMGVYVNNSSQAVAGFDNITLPNLLSSPQIYRNLVINSADNFKGGPTPTANTVTVKFYQSGTSNEIGEGSAILQAQGISGSPASTPTAKTDQQNYSIGGTMNVTVSNVPSTAASGYVCVGSANSGCNNYLTINGSTATVQIPVTTANGFQQTGSNSIAAFLIDSSGNPITPQITPVTVTTGGTSGTQMWGCLAAGTGGVYTCAATQSDPGIAACTTNGTGGIQSIPSQNCGCTQAEVSGGVTGSNCKYNGGTGSPNSSTGATNGNTAQTTFLFNPLPESDLTHTFLIVIQGFLGILGILAVLFIIVGGFQMVIAAGNEEMILKGKKTITWAVLGLLAALLSFSIIAITQSLLQATTTPQTSTSTTPQGTPPNTNTSQGTPPSGTTPQGTPPN